MKEEQSTALSTKDRILDAALDLFAEKGYEGASVDMIAAAAGIKGPSLYKHFKGKDQILDALITKVDEYYAANFNAAGRQNQLPESMDQLTRMAFAKVNFTMHDEVIQKTRRLLALGQFRNSRLSELATLHGITAIQTMFQKLFAAMMKAGIMKNDDPAILAMEFASPVSLLIQMYDREPAKEKEIIKKIKAHLKHFADVYGV